MFHPFLEHQGRLCHRDFEHFPTLWVFNGRSFFPTAIEGTHVLIPVEMDGGVGGQGGTRRLWQDLGQESVCIGETKSEDKKET